MHYFNLKLKLIFFATTLLLLTFIQVQLSWSQGITIVRYYDMAPPAGTYYSQSINFAVGRENGKE